MKAGYILNDRYKIIRSLGEGGMANVYLARDLVLDRDVSVKVLRLDMRDDENTKRRFNREALAATELNDPHIVGVYDVGEENGMQYMVMEYVEGTDLKAFIQTHPHLPIETAITIMTQILQGVEVAHQHGIIHRDLKPQNILINHQKQIKITDFGIATASNANALTQTNTLLGSVHYLSPEQAKGSVATKCSDVYSLGIILYELLTGQVPFEGETAISIALKHFRDEVPSILSLNPAVPQSLENVVLKATAKDPINRYQSAQAMLDDLSTALDPDRVDEPRFQATMADDETKVLDVQKFKDLDAAQIKDTNHSRSDTRELKLKHQRRRIRRRWWFLVCFLLIVLITGGGLYYYYNQTTSVPDLFGDTKTEAQDELASHHLKLGDVTMQYSSVVANGHVIKATGKETKKYGQSVNVIMSRGVKRYTLDDYTGENYQNVAEILQNKGFTVHKETVHSADYDKNTIIKQSIAANTVAHPGSDSITLTVSSGKDTVKVPNFKNKSISDVQAYATKHGLQLTTLTTQDSKVADNHVVSQQPAVGKKLSQGDTLTVTVATSASSDTEKTTNIQVTIPYDDDYKENKVSIYIRDDDHNYGTVYQTMTINQETTVNLQFKLRNNSTGSYRVIRDGRTIMSVNNITA
ncbi:Stk1 family PASTA domain-containing Ser/Thr kinase [Limosilactobacillus gastricus]|uniref:Stk1 family PASTA domain-containing Ser/Thr kinase n=1 Tax=Limosilactobacillus gastricus TaxID=227942 RepID=UPI0026EF1E54|nr:Stk1 family PASTA domain-containing Ser/Thr kinase [Limosilactobacillus gastricus]